MKTSLSSHAHSWAALLICLGMSALAPRASGYGVPVRVQFNFICNASNSRPASGNINTDAEVQDQVTRANEVLARWTSELRIESLGILDVYGASQFYATNTDGCDAIRNAAIADPSRYHWRTDAVNIYITAANDSAVSRFPPNNNIIICCQGSHLTTVIHELGHTLSLWHTHEDCCGVGDGCSDTLLDNSGWSQNDIAVNNYGANYVNLNTDQQYQVNMVWSNLMSYHNVDYRCMISSCQHDKMSTQTYTDRNWMLSRIPVYVDAAYGGSQNGSFTQPYQTVQGALNAGALNNRVTVLKTGTHNRPSSTVNTSTEVITRKGESLIRDAKPQYDLPYNLEESKNPKVRAAIIAVQQSDLQKDSTGAIAHLLEAEKNATGRERDAVRLELAQRYRDAGQLDQAAAWFEKLAADADQPALKTRAANFARDMKVLKERQQASKGEKRQPAK